MTAFERLLTVADDEVLALALEMIGKEQLALLIAKGLIALTTGKLQTAIVAKAFGIEARAAQVRIENTSIKME